MRSGVGTVQASIVACMQRSTEVSPQIRRPEKVSSR
jgi:hypothetical protein